jgi:uncharacterized protein (DUF488 family)
VKLFTIGFTNSSAEHFFGRLRAAAVSTLVDVRLNNRSQLAGFAKRDDLQFFCAQICGIGYQHMTQLAPTADMLGRYRKRGLTWQLYQQEFRALIAARAIEDLEREPFDGACLLCSEAVPHHCHRRLVAEYLREHWAGVDIVHL